jgi:hypothetical protein
VSRADYKQPNDQGRLATWSVRRPAEAGYEAEPGSADEDIDATVSVEVAMVDDRLIIAELGRRDVLPREVQSARSLP